MNRILLFDVETTGLDEAEGDCIELGAVVFSLVSMSVVKAYSTVLRTGKPNPIEHINHIPSGLLEEGTDPMGAWKAVDSWATQCDYVVGHNCEFDRKWVPSSCISNLGNGLLNKRWLDTCDGMTWPRQSRPSSPLIALCLDHGIGVVDPHRALNDCLLLSMLLRRVHELGYDVQAILAQDLRPKAVFEAVVSFEEKDMAKKEGFHWESESKQWVKRMAIEDAERLPFRVRRVG